jgi:hypothetical protein
MRLIATLIEAEIQRAFACYYPGPAAYCIWQVLGNPEWPRGCGEGPEDEGDSFCEMVHLPA